MRGDKLTLSDIEEWVDNHEPLYTWWKLEGGSKRAFVRANREELEAAIIKVRDAPPREKTWRDYA